MRHRLKPLPIQSLNFEVTRRCNSKCIYCNIWKTPSKIQEELRPDEIRDYFKPSKLFRDVFECGITGGEPTLRSDIVDLCQALKECMPNAHLGFPTNSLNPKTLDIILELRREVDPAFGIGISLDGFPEINDFQRGVPGHFEKAMALARSLKEQGIGFGIGSTVTAYNIEHLGVFRAWLRSQGFPHTYDVASESDNYYKNTGCISDFGLLEKSAEERKAYSMMLKRLSSKGSISYYHKMLPKFMREKQQVMKCFSGFSSFFVNHQGTVYPCIHLDLPYGNLRKTSFSDLWNGVAKKTKRSSWAPINPVRQEDNCAVFRRYIRDKQCYCWTSCEYGTGARCLLLPAAELYVEKKIKRVMNKVGIRN